MEAQTSNEHARKLFVPYCLRLAGGHRKPRCSATSLPVLPNLFHLLDEMMNKIRHLDGDLTKILLMWNNFKNDQNLQSQHQRAKPQPKGTKHDSLHRPTSNHAPHGKRPSALPLRGLHPETMFRALRKIPNQQVSLAA